MPSQRNVILGGGVAAGYAAREYVERGGDGPSLCVVSAEDRPPYDRPPLSKDVLQGSEPVDDALIEDAGFYAEHGIDLRLGTRVASVDLDARRLEVPDGQPIPFDTLLVATGSRVRRLGLGGADLANVFTLRTASDAERIVAAADGAERAVVVGAGFIGTEVAASLRQRGIEVALVFREERLLAGRPLTEPLSDAYAATFRDEGVELVPGTTVARLEGQARVSRVVLDSGQALDADLVVVGIGVEPETSLFEDTAVNVDDGILVDDHLRTGVEGVYAGGDVACYQDVLSGRRRRVEHWDMAQAHGQYWARVVTGLDEPFRHVPYFFSDAFELSWEYWGDQSDADDVVYRGDVDALECSAWWLKGDRVVAAFVSARPDGERQLAQRLIESGESVDAERLADDEAELPG